MNPVIKLFASLNCINNIFCANWVVHACVTQYLRQNVTIIHDIVPCIWNTLKLKLLLYILVNFLLST